ncbi:MAG: VCBS repeat-containing protein [Thermotogaceae bacterium]|nr:VCBS repeat-containing protein [Thermotogaceae bacterium]
MRKVLSLLIVVIGVFTMAYTLMPGGLMIFEMKDEGLTPLSVEEDMLPDYAIKAVQVTPPAWRDRLIETFYGLMERDFKSNGAVAPVLKDVNGDGLVDLVVERLEGGIEIYINHGSKFSPAFVKWNVDKIFSDTPEGTSLKIDLGDLNGDGLLDVVLVDNENHMKIYMNAGNKQKPLWKEVSYTLEKLPKGSIPRLVDLTGDGKSDLVLSTSSGEIFFYTNTATNNDVGFYFEKEKAGKAGYKGRFPLWPRPDGSSGLLVGNVLIPAFGDLDNDGLIDMVISNEKGKIFVFKNIGSESYPIWRKVKAPGLEDFEAGEKVFPYLADLNGDDLPEIVLGTSKSIMWVPNSSNPGNLKFRVWKSDAEKSWMGKFLWSKGYWDDVDKLVYFDPNDNYVKIYAEIILNSPDEFRDEASYIIANAFIKDLKKLADKGLADIVIRVPKAIYTIAKELKYVELVDENGYTTIYQKLEDGNWFKVPKEIYYEYIVMPNRYNMFFPGTEPVYEGKIFMEYLPYDKTYGKNLLEVVKNSEDVMEAVKAISNWVGVEIKARWRRGSKPRGWYNVYKEMLNNKKGFWCGEFSILVESFSRSVLIPTTIVLAFGEDHQFNQFYYGGKWVHWDQTQNEPEKSIGVFPNWYNYKEGRFSWVMSWEQNGRYDYVHHGGVVYKAPDRRMNLRIVVTDFYGTPIDGARITLWSHWPLENDYLDIPLPAAVTYTNTSGEAVIRDLSTKTYTISVVTPVGIKYITRRFEEAGTHEIHVIIEKILPVKYEKYSVAYIPTNVPEVHLSVKKATQKVQNWLYTGGTVYREYTNAKVKAYVVDRENLKRFLRGERFETFGAYNISSGKIPVPYGMYLIISNQRSAHTYVSLEISK